MRFLPVLLALPVVFAGCGGSDPKPSTGQLERDIRAEFEKGAADRNTGAMSEQEKIEITDVKCVRQSDAEATCRVDSAGPAGDERLDLVVSIDPDTGEYQWREAD